MSGAAPRGPDRRPGRGLRSWSADGSVWKTRRRCRGTQGGLEWEGPEGPSARSASCPRRWHRERRCSCSSPGEAAPPPDLELLRQRAAARRSLRQKFQDAVSHCLPLRSHHLHLQHHQHQRHPPGSRRPFSALLWSKRKIHAAELMHWNDLRYCPALEEREGSSSSSSRGWSRKVPPAASWDDLCCCCCRHPEGSSSSSSSSSRGRPRRAPADLCCCPALEEPEHPEQRSSSSSSSSSSRGRPRRLQVEPSRDDLCCCCCCRRRQRPPAPEEQQSRACELMLVPDLLQISNSSCYWGPLDRWEAEQLLEGRPEGTFLLRDSAQEHFLFSVSFRRYSRSLHTRIEQGGRRFGFDVGDPRAYRDASVTGLLRHYGQPAGRLFFEPLLSRPLCRTFVFSLQHLCRSVICSRTSYQGVARLPLPAPLLDYLRRYRVRCDL